MAVDKMSIEDEIEQVFCKKYARFQLEADSDVFKRQQFESYKRLTKDHRINNIKHKLQKTHKISKKQKQKCFDRLSKDAERRKSMERSSEREQELELSLKKKKRLSQTRVNEIYLQMMEKEEKKNQKI